MKTLFSDGAAIYLEIIALLYIIDYPDLMVSHFIVLKEQMHNTISIKFHRGLLFIHDILAQRNR